MALGEAYPLRLLCRLLEVPRSSLYYRPKGLGEEEERLCARLRELAGTWPRYGYRRLGALLREEGFRIGDKRVRSLMREEGLLLPRHPPKLNRFKTLPTSARLSRGKTTRAPLPSMPWPWAWRRWPTTTPPKP